MMPYNNRGWGGRGAGRGGGNHPAEPPPIVGTDKDTWLEVLQAAESASQRPDKGTVTEVVPIRGTPRATLRLADRFGAMTPKEEWEDCFIEEDGTPGDTPRWKARVVLARPATREIVIELDDALRVLPVQGQSFRIWPANFWRVVREWVEQKVADDGSNVLARARDRFATSQREAPKLPAFAKAEGAREGQRKAFDLARRDVSVVWGPPGTGKTWTLGRVIAAHVAAGRKVMAVAPTRVAADNLLLAVDDALTEMRGNVAKAGELVRCQAPELEALKQRNHLLSYDQAVQEGILRRNKHLDRMRELSDASKAQTGAERARLLADAASAREAAEAEKQALDGHLAKLVNDATVVACTLQQWFSKVQVNGKRVDVVVLDEASMVPVAKALPLLLRRSQVIVAGDFRQLAPIDPTDSYGKSRAPEWLGTDLFGLLGIESDEGGVRTNRSSTGMALLDQQSRMAPEICKAIATAFYDGRLTAVGAPPQPVALQGWPSERFVTLKPRREASSAADEQLLRTSYDTVKGNMSVEAARATYLAVRVLAQSKHSVAVMSAYGPQAGLYRRLLQGMSGVQSGTVHTMQGQEADVAFYDTVEPGKWFVATSSAAPRLANVAVSRARKQVVLVGQKNELALNPWLRGMVAAAAEAK